MNKNSLNLPDLTDLSNERVLVSADADTMQITIKLIEDAITYVQKEHAELPEMMEDLKSSLHDVRAQVYFLQAAFVTDQNHLSSSNSGPLNRTS